MRKVFGWLMMIAGLEIGIVGSLVFQSGWAVIGSAVLLLSGCYFIDDDEGDN